MSGVLSSDRPSFSFLGDLFIGFRVSVFGSWGLRVSGSGFRVSGVVFQVSCFVFRVSCFGLRVLGVGCRVSGCGLRVSDSVFRVLSFQFRVSSCGFWVSGEARLVRRAREVRLVHLLAQRTVLERKC